MLLTCSPASLAFCSKREPMVYGASLGSMRGLLGHYVPVRVRWDARGAIMIIMQFFRSSQWLTLFCPMKVYWR